MLFILIHYVCLYIYAITFRGCMCTLPWIFYFIEIYCGMFLPVNGAYIFLQFTVINKSIWMYYDLKMYALLASACYPFSDQSCYFVNFFVKSSGCQTKWIKWTQLKSTHFAFVWHTTLLCFIFFVKDEIIFFKWIMPLKISI